MSVKIFKLGLISQTQACPNYQFRLSTLCVQFPQTLQHIIKVGRRSNLMKSWQSRSWLRNYTPFTYLVSSLPRSQNPDTSHAPSHINTVHHTHAQSSLTIPCNFNRGSLQNSLSKSFAGLWYKCVTPTRAYVHSYLMRLQLFTVMFGGHYKSRSSKHIFLSPLLLVSTAKMQIPSHHSVWTRTAVISVPIQMYFDRFLRCCETVWIHICCTTPHIKMYQRHNTPHPPPKKPCITSKVK